MANYSSVAVYEPLKDMNRWILVQVLVSLFLCINSVLIITFFLKKFFYTKMRYILFATSLVADYFVLILSNLMLIFFVFSIHIQMWWCLILTALAVLYNFVTPVTLTAMTLECYIAICMPLHHAELCSTRNALYSIGIIHCIGFIPYLIVMSIFISSFPLLYHQYRLCSVDLLVTQSWQRDLRSAVSQMYFLIMFVIIIFSYVKIMKAAKAASGDNKKSTKKATRTVILHGFQLLLCLAQLWCPLTEGAALKVNFKLFLNIRFFNYIMFIIFPRCLSPLIYGLRDDKFRLALKYYFFCGFVSHKYLDLTN